MSCNCNNSNVPPSCNNPCAVTATNTAACETLPSQVENFTHSFFGTVVKTEVDGRVTWVLPCDLDVGLENNPRGEDEGLACYFLRLFREGIVGLTGPQGETGAPGEDGLSAFTVTILGFAHPSEASPQVSVRTAYNPAILQSLYVFIQTSGWYLVNSVDANTGVLSLTLVKSVPGASGTIAAGKLVVPSGFPGASVTGPTGPQGIQGEKGDAGDEFTPTNDQYAPTVGTDYELQTVFDAVNFINSSPQFLLPFKGRYLVTATVPLQGQTGVATNDIAKLKLFNVSNSGGIAGSEQWVSNLVDGQNTQVVINCIVETDGDAQTVGLYGSCTTADKVAVVALRTVLTYTLLEKT